MEIPIKVEGTLINETHWLGFFGSYIGACASVLIMLYIMHKTNMKNSENIQSTLDQNQTNHTANQNQNNKLLQLQINTTKYNRAMQEIDNLRDILDKSYRTIDYQRFSMAINYIKLEDLNAAILSLLQINRDIELHGNTFDLYITPTEKNTTNVDESACMDTFRSNLTSYGVLVNDFIFVVNLLTYYNNYNNATGQDFFNYIDATYKEILKCDPQDYAIAEEYAKETNIYCLLLKIEMKATFTELIPDVKLVIEERLLSVLNMQSNKRSLIVVSQNLLTKKQAEAEKILTEKLEN